MWQQGLVVPTQAQALAAQIMRIQAANAARFQLCQCYHCKGA